MSRFEARELKDYAEPVAKGDLTVGATYFFLNFEDEEMLNPVLQPVVFLGRDLEEGDHGRVYFQDLGSYRSGVRYGGENDGKPASIFTGSEDQIGHVFEFEKALDQLLDCSLRRERREARSGR